MGDQSQHGLSGSAEMPASGTPQPANGSLPVEIPVRTRSDDSSEEKSEVLQRFWEAVKRLPAYVRLAAAMAKDPDVPKAAKAIMGAGGAYAVSPIDLVPGVIPVAGQLDDVYVLLTAIQQSLKRTPDEVADRHLEAAQISRDDIDGDLKAVRDLVRVAVVKSVTFGGKALGRVSRAAFRIANTQLKRRSTGRGSDSR